MRAVAFACAVVLSWSGSAFAQDWDLYVSKEDGFKIDFPGQPKIADTTWTSEYGFVLPARVYSAEMGSGKYSMTVVDYTQIERLGMERSKRCPAGAETCMGQVGGQLRPVIGPSYAIQDIRGALVYASFKLLQRNVKVTGYLWNWEDLVEGHELHLTSNADQSRTMAFIAMHENKLYVMEGTVPKGFPEPGLFFQSLGWVDKDGNGIRYQAIYSNEFHGLRIDPPPPINAAARGAGPGPAAPAGAPAGAGR